MRKLHTDSDPSWESNPGPWRCEAAVPSHCATVPAMDTLIPLPPLPSSVGGRGEGGRGWEGARTLTLRSCIVDNLVDFVGFGDVELGSFGNLLELGALVQCTPQPGLPSGWVHLVTIFKLTLKLSPSLLETTSAER